MSDKNGLSKNLAVVADEVNDWIYRIQGVLNRPISLRADKTNVFHVLTALISDTYQAFPRLFTYMTLAYLIGKAHNYLVGLL